ncbi:rRNA maturation RNase YbeY [Shimia gijangensis]|nr:rRNA maturation RNase YbeY [Shimia gijangensis]
MVTDLILEDDRWALANLEAIAETAAQLALNHLDLSPTSYVISILGCDDARIATLNADFRGKLSATNVLSWPAQDLAATTDGDPPLPPAPDSFEEETELGDIAIAYETCLREANDASKPLKHHITHLVIHGVLHLLGFDHIRDKDATLMEGIETVILGKMGIPDPYREEHGD